MGLLLGIAYPSTGRAAIEDFYVFHFDKIPRFGYSPFVKSPQYLLPTTQNGSMSQLGAGINDPNAVVLVRHDVVLTGDMNVWAIVVEAGGKLTFADQNITVRFLQFVVEEGASLTIGTEGNPVNSRVRLIVRALPINTSDPNKSSYDPGQFGHGLLGFGNVTMHGETKTSFMRLATAPRAGNSSLSLLNSVTNWKSGDKVVIPDTRIVALELGNLTFPNEGAVGIRTVDQTEVRTLSGSAATSASLNSGLSFDHLGAVSADGTQPTNFGGEPLNPHVGNLSRNISIESEDPNVVRGHTMFHHRANININGVAFTNLGRTRTVYLNSTTFDANGNALSVGTNQIGRYPVHFHHLAGPNPATDPQHQFRLENCAIDTSPKWGVAIHGSSYGLIKNNVIYDCRGGGIIFENGSEFRNRIERNFIVKIPGHDGSDGDRVIEIRGDIQFRQGVAIGETTPDNDIIANVSADIHEGETVYQGFTIGGREGQSRLPVRKPLFRGADVNVAGQFEEITGVHVPYGVHEGAEVYSSAKIALGAWQNHEAGFEFIPSPLIKNFAAWNTGGSFNAQGATIFVDYSVFHIDGAKLYGGRRVFFAHNPTGRDGMLFKDMAIHNFEVGFDYDNRPPITHTESAKSKPTWEFVNLDVVNVKSGIVLHNELQGPNPLGKIYTVLRNVKFRSTNSVPYAGVDFQLRYDPHSGPDNVGGPTIWTEFVTESYDHNGVPGVNKELFFPIQGPNIPIRKWCGTYTLFNGPEEFCFCPGLKSDGSLHTNASCEAEFGPMSAAFRHAATCEDTDPSFTNGLACNKAVGGNSAPVVNAGPGQTVLFPNPVNLAGSHTDDGLPAGGTITRRWVKIVGPGNVTFTAPTSAATSATFSQPGHYTLRYIVNDGNREGAANLVVLVSDPNGSNEAPSVSAGEDRVTPFPAAVNLSGSVSDDGMPASPGRLTILWTKESGMGSVIFENAASPITEATFSRPGSYILRLTATDGEKSTNDHVQVLSQGVGGAGTVGGTVGNIVSPAKQQTVFIPGCGNGTIRDLKGRTVMTFSGPDLIWGGQRSGGRLVADGVYIYTCSEGKSGKIAVVP